MNPFPILHIFIHAATATSNHSAAGSTMSMQPVDYDTELQDAARDGDVGRVQALLADERVNSAFWNNSAICGAAYHGHEECVRLLLADPRANPAASNNAAICAAAQNGHAKCLQILLADPRVNPSADNNDVIRLATQYGHTECVRLLLADERVDPAADDNYPIGVAAANGHAECVRLLLADPRVDPAADDNYAIRFAAYYGRAECVKLLLADGRVNPAAQDSFALGWAATNDDMECAKLLLADARVEPSVNSGIPCFPEIRSLIKCIQACKDGDLEAFQQMSLAALSDTVLDIFVARNRLFPKVLRYLADAQLAHLAVPETIRDDPAFETCINSARSIGVWRTGELRGIIRTFIRLKRHAEFPSDLAVIIAAHSCYPIA